MQYWKNLLDNKVYGYDISDPNQVIARDERISIGSWEDITGNWPPAPTPPTAEQNKNTAITLLSKTDWVNEPDVYNPSNTPHLQNRQEFLDYRLAVRQYAVNPIAGNIDWPTLPSEQWSSLE